MAESTSQAFRIFAVVELIERRRPAIAMHRLDVRVTFQAAFE
jgi:hypothetical protein